MLLRILQRVGQYGMNQEKEGYWKHARRTKKKDTNAVFIIKCIPEDNLKLMRTQLHWRKRPCTFAKD